MLSIHEKFESGLVYGSVCSGIEAATVAWAPLGWRADWYAEIDPFCSALLKHHYPETYNHGNFTHIGADAGPIDVLVGGTPCQSFSVAGQRAGLDDPRGNLTLEFLALAGRLRPRWLVWENVPGVLSIDGGDVITRFLDHLESLGYVLDIDILDAQHFGVPQRRRRVFVCGQLASDLLQQKTISSGLTVAQCLIEILHLALVVHVDQLKAGRGSSDHEQAQPRVHSLKRRMKLFGLDSDFQAQILLGNLDAILPPSDSGPFDSDSGNGKPNTKTFETTKSCGLTEPDEFQNTEMSLPNLLAETLRHLRLSITSTSESAITDSTIYTYAKTLTLIVERITHCTNLSPTFWTAASSASIALMEFINYARSASSSLFTDVGWLQPWGDFVREAEDLYISLRCLGEWHNSGAFLSFSDSLSGNPPPRREAGQGVARGFEIGPSGGGFTDVNPTLDARCKDGPIRNQLAGAVAMCLNAGGQRRIDTESETFVVSCQVANTLSVANQTTGFVGDVVAHSLRADGFDASEDGTGRGTPLVPVPILEAGARTGKSTDDPRAGMGIGEPGDPMFTLQSGKQHAIAFHQNQRGEITVNDTAGSLKVGGGKPGQGYPAVAVAMPRDVASILGQRMRGEDDCMVNNAIAIAFTERGRDKGRTFECQEDVAYCLTNPGSGGRSHSRQVMTPHMAVRRLTPRECERLQGFPDDYTLIPYRGKPAADGPRYKAVGNSMAVPVMRWIGERIAAVEQIGETK